MGQFTIDTLNKTDRDNAMVALHAVAINNGEDLLFRPINDYNDKASKLEIIKTELLKCQDDNNSLKEELKKEINSNNTLLEANKTLNTKLTNCEEQNSILKAEINDLKEKLSAYVVGFGGDGDNEIKYFKPEEDKLVETKIQNSAFFIGASKSEDVFEFQFNEGKAPHNKAIQFRNEILIPFCDIVYEAPDANYIVNKSKGSFSIANGEFKIIDKVKISIIKQ